MANSKIDAIEGIGPATAEKLSAAGIVDTDGLLEAGCTKSGRKQIAEKSGCSESQVLEWVNHADLFRVKGVGGEFAELLEAGGVDTVRELATRSPENLARKLFEVNAEKQLTRRTPSPDVVKGWVEQARSLPPKVEH